MVRIHSGGQSENEKKERNKEYQHNWYLKNKKVQCERSARTRNKNKKLTKEYIKKLKTETPCADCGKFYPSYVMDFDHKYNKKFLISRSVSSGIHTLDKIKEEISKCDIVCANCHRIRTFG